MSQCTFYKNESDGSVRFCVADDDVRHEHEDYLGFRYGRWLRADRRPDAKRLANLGASLAAAGALCAAHARGYQTFEDDYHSRRWAWRPGCGREMPR